MTQIIISIIAQRSYRVQMYPASGAIRDLVLRASLQHLKPSVTILPEPWSSHHEGWTSNDRSHAPRRAQEMGYTAPSQILTTLRTALLW